MMESVNLVLALKAVLIGALAIPPALLKAVVAAKSMIALGRHTELPDSNESIEDKPGAQ